MGVLFWQYHMAIEGVSKIVWVHSHPNRLLSISAPPSTALNLGLSEKSGHF